MAKICGFDPQGRGSIPRLGDVFFYSNLSFADDVVLNTIVNNMLEMKSDIKKTNRYL